MLLDEIRNDPILNKFLCNECAENEIGITIDPIVPRDRILIIKVDNYYNTEVPHPAPKSPDCLIIQLCDNGEYRLFVVELKNAVLATIKIKDIREKFQTCLSDFMSNRFRNYFYNNDYVFKSLKLYFITDPLNQRNNAGLTRPKNSTKLDLLLALPPCEFANRKYIMSHLLPNPNISLC